MGSPTKFAAMELAPFEVGSQGKWKKLGVTHKLTSPYNSGNNGGAERAVRALKHCLNRDGVTQVTQQVLDKVCFLTNNHSQAEAGSANERFFGHAPRSYLTNSVERFVDHRALIAERQDKQVKLAHKKGRTSVDKFEVNDLVTIQDNHTKRWTGRGKITEERQAEDGTIQSFLIVTNAGREIIRNKRFLKHMPGKVTFADSRQSSPDDPVEN